MALVSSKVAAGMTILADHFNKLWSDLTANHDHSSGQGGTVDHVNLADSGNMSGFNHNHTDLEIHILGSGPGGNEIDAIGGDMGVHGLAASAYVAGNLNTSQMVFFVGKVSPFPIDGQTVYYSPTGASPATVTFSTTPYIFISGEGDSGDETHPKCIYDASSIGTTYFTLNVGGDSGTRTAVHFLAIGTKT